MSHSMYMLSIQIDTKKFESVKQHQIVLLYKSCEMQFQEYGPKIQLKNS